MICNKNCQINFNKKLKERFLNTYKISNYDNYKIILLLRKGVYTYKYMNNWEKLYETSLPEKIDFYGQLNMKDITDKD